MSSFLAALGHRRGSRTTRTLLALGVTIVAAAGVDGARAAIHACPTADGTTVFQDRPCERIAPAARERRARRPDTPVGLHPSWFERPARARERAWCDERGCECGAQERRFDGRLALAVSDALYLDGAWHRYERSAAALDDVANDDEAALDRLRRQLEEAACEVQMAQRTLHAHAERVLGALRARARAAEERGFDDPAACDAGGLDACEYLGDVELYRRMLDDLAALRLPRGGGEDPLTEGARSSP